MRAPCRPWNRRRWRVNGRRSRGPASVSPSAGTRRWTPATGCCRRNSPETHCAACRHNRIIPDLSDAENLTRWRRLETAKHHLFYTLTNLGLPLRTRLEDPEYGLGFDFLPDRRNTDGTTTPVLTGHDNGLITINVAEADDAERERRRTAMGEPYRTLLGHFRHEIGHYVWDRLVGADPATLNRFRALFGDERADYGAALERHYADGPPADWQSRFVSGYAAAHPWEDFAETWAHYLHIVDTLESARAFGLRIRPRVREGAALTAEVDFNPHKARCIEDLIDAWLPLTYAVNSLNRSMGQPDFYPFILSPAAIEKLGFMNGLVRALQPWPQIQEIVAATIPAAVPAAIVEGRVVGLIAGVLRVDDVAHLRRSAVAIEIVDDRLTRRRSRRRCGSRLAEGAGRMTEQRRDGAGRQHAAGDARRSLGGPRQEAAAGTLLAEPGLRRVIAGRLAIGGRRRRVTRLRRRRPRAARRYRLRFLGARRRPPGAAPQPQRVGQEAAA